MRGPSLGGDLNGVVITVPAYFDDAQRQATKDARAWRDCTYTACSTSRPRRPLPMAWTAVPTACMRSMISAAARSTSRCAACTCKGFRGDGDRW